MKERTRGYQGKFFYINCCDCMTPVPFALETLNRLPALATCPGCHRSFGLEPGSLARHIKLFVDLCHQLQASEEILSQTAVGVRVGHEEVKVPLKLLLTRMRSTLDLDIDGKKLCISYRTAPLEAQDTSALS